MISSFSFAISIFLQLTYNQKIYARHVFFSANQRLSIVASLQIRSPRKNWQSSAPPMELVTLLSLG
ncbi:unnamed protein product [Arabidopsis lyrata]|nr:unnamed protein product [Arabidopsis lyrata]